MIERLCMLTGLWFLLLSSVAMAEPPQPPPPNPANPVDYVAWINDTFAAPVEPNAYDIYVKAYEQLQPFEGSWGDTLSRPWSGENDVSGWLEANRDALDLFRTAAAIDGCFMRVPDVTGQRDARLDHYLMLFDYGGRTKRHREAVKGLLANAWRAWAAGDRELFLAEVRLSSRAAHHVRQSVFPVESLIGFSGLSYVHATLRRSLDLADDRDAWAQRLQRPLPAFDPPLSSKAGLLLGERLTAWDVCQRVYLPGPKPGVWVFHPPSLNKCGSQGMPPLRARFGLLPKIIPFEETLAEFNAYYDAVDHWWAVPFHQATDEPAKVRKLATDSKNILVTCHTPNFERLRLLIERSIADRRATHLIVHIFAHRARTGQLPHTLDDLSCPDLSNLRIDPFSGRDLVYQRTDDGFVLYSVAENGKDDRGRHNRRWDDGDFVFWPVQPDPPRPKKHENGEAVRLTCTLWSQGVCW